MERKTGANLEKDRFGVVSRKMLQNVERCYEVGGRRAAGADGGASQVPSVFNGTK
jgi:hypothetical protein